MSHVMPHKSLDYFGWKMGVALLFLGCCPPPPAVTPTAAPAPTEEAPAAVEGAPTAVAPAPAEPDCESTLKACKATDATRLKIQDTPANFHPPTGWNYAKEADQSVAFSPDRTAMLAFTTAPSRSRDDIVTASKKLVARLHIQNVKYAWLTPRLKTTQHELEAGPHTMELWEVNKSSQFGAPPKLEGEVGGTLLLVVATVEGVGVFVGTAFVTKPDGDEHAAAVMQSLQTFRASGARDPAVETKSEPAQ